MNPLSHVSRLPSLALHLVVLASRLLSHVSRLLLLVSRDRSSWRHCRRNVTHSSLSSDSDSTIVVMDLRDLDGSIGDSLKAVNWETRRKAKEKKWNNKMN
uniref:Uncharacterized protein n=1 Tax=Cacopsylla melanoneura TaxID=428564 RepID=A0A8D8YNS4_9HEMI